MDTKAKIMEAVIKEAKNSFIGKISTISVSKNAGTSESNIYKIYKTKDNLLVETFLYIDAKAAKAVSIDYDESDLQSIDRMTNLIYRVWRKYVDFFSKNYSYIHYYGSFRTNKLFNDAVYDKQRTNYDKLVPLFQAAREAINTYSGINYDLFFMIMLDTTLSICQRIASKAIENTDENILSAFHLIFDSVLNY